MPSDHTERRLAAILAADMVGYSQLMEADEAGTLAQLKTHRKEIIDPKIADHHGRIVKLMGDGMLAEFASVVDAVECAVEVQRAMEKRNADVPKDRQIRFRVGINLGDVIAEDDDIYGEGVNIAARLEELCEPGDVFISGTAYDHLKRKVDVDYEFLGERQVKNIAEPVRVYRMLMGPAAAGARVGAKRPRPAQWHWAALAAGVAVALATGGVTVWLKPWAPDIAPASVGRMALPLPDKPSIAVLPFTNLSGDPEQEYFADGMAEDIITDLSHISGLFVIARNSSFAYKGKQADVRTIARELGVKYILEGSVRRADDSVRINAQLIDAATGGHLWAKRYDGTLADVFGLQDMVTKQIVTALSVKLTQGEQKQTARKETANSEAYDAFLKGWDHYRRRTPEDFGEAVSYFDKAIELDPDYSRAYAALAATYWGAFFNWWSYALPVIKGVGHSQSRMAVRDRARKYLEMAMSDPTPLAYRVAAAMHAQERRHDEAVAEAERALALDTNDADSHVAIAAALVWGGRADEAVPHVERAMRLDPHYPASYLYVLGLAHFVVGRLQDATAQFETVLKRNPENRETLVLLAAMYGGLGREQEARASITRYLKFRGANVSTSYGVRYYMRRLPFRDATAARRFGNGLIKAGVCCQDEVEEFIDRMRKEGLLE
jgi:TolB-like protein/class 3 adenylate cyclase/cytochrome c-type biogenesis protein CcmH/NrfG